jgi:hypothetical protein
VEATRREYDFLPPRWLRRWIFSRLDDARDEPVACLLLEIMVTTVPAALGVFLAPPSHALGAAYLALNYFMLFPRFVVALLHVTEHRKLFKNGTEFEISTPLADETDRSEFLIRP